MTFQPLANSDLVWQVYAEPMPGGAWFQVGRSDHHWRETRGAASRRDCCRSPAACSSWAWAGPGC